MSESKQVTTDRTSYGLGGVILILFLVGLIGGFGKTGQSITLHVLVLLSPVCISLFIRSSVWLLNRTCRYCREALSAAPENNVVECDIDPKAEELQSNLDAMRRDEVIYADRYSLRRCSSDDWIRAQALRVQAEIELLRHQRMPKSWADTCRQVQLRRR